MARWAPSGTNMQPWKAYVTTGPVKDRIAEAILNSGIRAEKVEWEEYKYYPDQFFEPYQTRRRTVGFGLYNALGIGRREVERMREQHDRNFIFFGAPVGLLFTIDRRLNAGSWVDLGMMLQNVMIAARARDCTPARRQRLHPITSRFARSSAWPTRRYLFAESHLATRTLRSRRTSSGPSVRRSMSGSNSATSAR